MASQGGSSKRSLSLTNTSLQDKKKPFDASNGGPSENGARHLPVVENGEVIALLDIAKCLYDAIARMERAAEKGKAIAADVEGVEKHWGTSGSVLCTKTV
ncbi:hypothetical protein TB2_034626 [Malus domestica]